MFSPEGHSLLWLNAPHVGPAPLPLRSPCSVHCVLGQIRNVLLTTSRAALIQQELGLG